MSTDLKLYGEPINPGQAHLLSNNTWAFKAFIRPLGRGDGFKKTPPLTLSRAISRDLTGIARRIVMLKDGGLLLEVCSAQMLSKLLNIAPLVVCGLRCFAYTPDDMVTVRGVIHNIPLDYSPVELVQTLEAKVNSENIFIMKASRIQNRFGAPTAVVALTFFGKVLPECVRVAKSDFFIPVFQYITPPLRCFKCQNYGHTSGKCPNNTICARCASAHNSRLCTSRVVCCNNCQGSHTARSSRCPVYLWASKIQEYKDAHGCSWARAELACGLCPSASAVSCPQNNMSNPPHSPSFKGPRFTFKVNQSEQVRTLQYINNNKISDIAHTRLDRQQVTAHEDSKKSKNETSVAKTQTPPVSPIKNVQITPTEVTSGSESSITSLIETPSNIKTKNGGRNSTPENKRGEPSLTDVTVTDSSLGEASPPRCSIQNKPEKRDASTQMEPSVKIEKFVQTETHFENNFINKFDLGLLLANLKSLISDLDSRNGNYTQNFLKQKFISSFIASYQKAKPTKSEEDKSSRHVVLSEKPVRRATPVLGSRPTKPSSLPKPNGSRLKSLNSPLKTAVGSRRFSLGSPQAFRGVKKQILKP